MEESKRVYKIENYIAKDGNIEEESAPARILSILNVDWRLVDSVVITQVHTWGKQLKYSKSKVHEPNICRADVVYKEGCEPEVWPDKNPLKAIEAIIPDNYVISLE